MLRYLFSSLILLLSCAQYSQAQTVIFPFAGKTVILADSSTAARLNATPDGYTSLLSPFDLAIRLQHQPATAAAYLDTASRGVHDWPEIQQEQLRGIFSALEAELRNNGYRLPLPDTLYLIKSDTREEFGAEGYTRANRIMLNTNVLPVSKQLVAHELFHVLSRYNEDWRNAIYRVFHFEPCNNINFRTAVPKAISNPDCPYLMHYIRVHINGKAREVSLLLYAKKEFEPGRTINDYASLGLLALKGKKKKKQVMLDRQGQPVIYELEQAADFFSQVGRNSNYILHIEELAAEHFAALMSGQKLPQPIYLEQIRGVLLY